MFIVNTPPRKVWVRKEYLYDLRKGHGEYTLGYWVSLKSIWGRSFYFETYMPEFGACFDKLPISAFIDWDSDKPEGPGVIENDLPLSDLQYWDSFDYDTEIINKQFLHSMSVNVRHRSGKTTKGGKYVFTVDSCHRDLDRPDLSYSETPEEHKSHNVIVLPNGQIGLYPNNRCQWFDESLTPDDVKFPDFLVSTRRFSVEDGGSGKRLGDSEDYFWDYPEWTTDEDDQLMDEALDAIENQVTYNPDLPWKSTTPLTSGNDYQGPLYAPHPDIKKDA